MSVADIIAIRQGSTRRMVEIKNFGFKDIEIEL